jgi:hypothetical protein
MPLIVKDGIAIEAKYDSFQWRIQEGGLWGLQPPPPRISQAHILTYAFQG